ncbi:rod shape-determining protein MreC [Myxococcus sp. 1LA]
MWSLLKRYYRPLTVGFLLLAPLVAFLLGGRKVRDPNFVDRAIIAVASPVQQGLTSVIEGGVAAVQNYMDLRGVRQENDALRLENLQLRAAVQSLGESRMENERLRKLLNYAEAEAGPEIPARVVGVNPVAKLLSVRISSGEQQGVFRGMSVVTPDGIVGQVIRATGGYADVALVTDPQSRVAVRVQRSRARGTAAGTGGGPLKLENMLRTEDVEDGDLIITAGTDGIYPPGVVVGRVTNLEKKEHGMFQGADIVPAVDTSKLEEVLVVGSPYSAMAPGSTAEGASK